jgi:hypothetical protein
MKVFNLACELGHQFEGWFPSSEGYDKQALAKQIECPMCASKNITKLLSAPRLNLASSTVSEQPAQEKPTMQQLHAMWLKMARSIVQSSEDVGERFADEARRIHYDEAPARSIRGKATQDEAKDLAEEGIEVFSFPMPKSAKEPLQ